MKAPKNWYKRAFTKAYIEAFNNIFPEPINTEITFLKKYIPIRNSKILDLACGYGRHALELTRLGGDVVGVDASTDFISLARERAVASSMKIDFIIGDIRTIDLRQTYDAVLLLGSVFGSGDDVANAQMIRNCSRHLRKGGVFVLELPNAIESVHAFTEKKSMVHTCVQKDGHEFEIIERYEFNIATMVKTSCWMGKKDKKIMHKFLSAIRYYTYPEIVIMLQSNHLRIKKSFGSYRGDAFGIHSGRLILVIEKF